MKQENKALKEYVQQAKISISFDKAKYAEIQVRKSKEDIKRAEKEQFLDNKKILLEALSNLEARKKEVLKLAEENQTLTPENKALIDESNKMDSELSLQQQNLKRSQQKLVLLEADLGVLDKRLVHSKETNMVLTKKAKSLRQSLKILKSLTLGRARQKGKS